MAAARRTCVNFGESVGVSEVSVGVSVGVSVSVCVRERACVCVLERGRQTE